MAAPGTVSYEFTEEQNVTLRTLASYMRNVGVFYSLLGLLGLIAFGALFVSAGQIPQMAATQGATIEGNVEVIVTILRIYAALGFLFSLIPFIVGLLTNRSARDFRRVVDTTGHDVGHLMSALEHLSGAFRILFYIAFVTLFIVVVAIYAPLVHRFVF